MRCRILLGTKDRPFLAVFVFHPLVVPCQIGVHLVEGICDNPCSGRYEVFVIFFLFVFMILFMFLVVFMFFMFFKVLLLGWLVPEGS